ncbi:beta-propeller fold lactonase family protein [Planctomyces sp. SH-PL62]|uniref:beta-propeller fold lactonase family protein n=1 Tax=Planctomyces sp. SH-PL62 TaxID=1636152 RepID=UPI00078BCF0D|nr:beta-propeller fold lactonase family protein [Planctomyces sp. SH-PL62]AMV39712.1 Cytochrome c551 peroxidase precursor [Planctomyces sp. SH-PL62]
MRPIGRPTLGTLVVLMTTTLGIPAHGDDGEAAPHRSPVALALSADGTRLLTANQTAGTVSLIDTASRTVLDETVVGDKPAGVAFAPDGRRAIVANWYGYDLAVLEIDGDKLRVASRIEVGPEPRGTAIAADGKTAYVAVGVADEVARVDLDALQVTGRVGVGREPRGLALSPDGKTLVVGNARSQNVSVIDVDGFQVAKTVAIEGENLRQLSIAADGRYAYLANMKDRQFATTRNNIDQGWVVGQRLTRIDLKEPEPYATISLDVRGKAAADAHGVAISPDGALLVVGLGGTHEIMIFRAAPKRLPWRIDGSRDLIQAELQNDEGGRFRRVALGGRPTELAFAPDARTLYVANYLDDSVQVVDAETATLVATIPLGSPSTLSLARRGEILFHDATRSFNQWYSCNTCHSDGHTNGLHFDTLNDGRQDLRNTHERSRKKSPTLRRVTHTAPWTWHGWQTSLEHATSESFTKSMQGTMPTDEEARAVVAYLETLDFPRNPYTRPDGSLTPEAERGKAVFKSAKAACNTCHRGPEFTDGKIHVVGLEEPDDAYEGYNPPSLRGAYDKYPYLHDARSPTLHDALTGPHSPEMVGGESLSEQELSDLIAFVKSL